MAKCLKCGGKISFFTLKPNTKLCAQCSKMEYDNGIDCIQKIITLYKIVYNYNANDDINSAIEKCNEIKRIAKKLSNNAQLKKVIDKQITFSSSYDRSRGTGRIEGLPMSIDVNDTTYPDNVPEALSYIAEICEERINSLYNQKLKLYEFEQTLQEIRACTIALSNENIKKNALNKISDIPFSSVTTRSNYERLGNFIVIDTETTGLTASKDEIIEVAAIKFEDWLPICKFSTLIKPKKEIPLEITDISGITNDMVADAPAIQEIIPALNDFIGNSPIVGHNLLFDIKFLYKNGLDLFSVKHKFYDTLDLAQKVLKKQKNESDYAYDVKNHKLTTLCDYYSIRDNSLSHRATSDCLATGILFNILVKSRIGIED